MVTLFVLAHANRIRLWRQNQFESPGLQHLKNTNIIRWRLLFLIFMLCWPKLYISHTIISTYCSRNATCKLAFELHFSVLSGVEHVALLVEGTFYHFAKQIKYQWHVGYHVVHKPTGKYLYLFPQMIH